MLNRRHLRIKIFHALYAYFQQSKESLDKGEKELFHSIAKMREMYISLLLIFVEIAHQANLHIEEKKRKKLPSHEDLNPNMRFVENALIVQLEQNQALKNAAEKEKMGWGQQQEMMKKMYRMLIETDEYKSYMEAPETDYESDRQLIISLFKTYVVNHEPLQQYFEDNSIYWVDDLDLASSMVLKTFKLFGEGSGSDQPILELYKDPEDEQQFVRQLYRQTILQSVENEALINAKAENWDMERIALLDMILMKMALSEAREFRQIPTKVTLNEYIEISKYYSTPKSNTFINGILDKLFAEMKESGMIKKTGRGLIEN
ncbi:MAG: transcription antitermination protein NusB [Cryomorphaceae bacterium]|nr:MAG: transcription antitermination protein NusB [Cryomorphaceae bacterium]